MIFWIVYIIVSVILLTGLSREVKAAAGEISRGAVALAVVVVLVPLINIMLLFMAIMVARHERKLRK